MEEDRLRDRRRRLEYLTKALSPSAVDAETVPGAGVLLQRATGEVEASDPEIKSGTIIAGYFVPILPRTAPDLIDENFGTRIRAGQNLLSVLNRPEETDRFRRLFSELFHPPEALEPFKLTPFYRLITLAKVKAYLKKHGSRMTRWDLKQGHGFRKQISRIKELHRKHSVGSQHSITPPSSRRSSASSVLMGPHLPPSSSSVSPEEVALQLDKCKSIVPLEFFRENFSLSDSVLFKELSLKPGGIMLQERLSNYLDLIEVSHKVTPCS